MDQPTAPTHLTEAPPNLSCPECGSREISGDPEGACACENGHLFWDTEAWEWVTLRRAQDAERALVTLHRRNWALVADTDPALIAALRLQERLTKESEQR